MWAQDSLLWVYCLKCLARRWTGGMLGFALIPEVTVPIVPIWDSSHPQTLPDSHLFSSSISQVQGETQSVCTAKAERQVLLPLPVTWPCSPALRLTAPANPPASFSQV